MSSTSIPYGRYPIVALTTDTICIQIAKLYDELIHLEGQYPPGRYLLRVNSLEKVFTTD